MLSLAFCSVCMLSCLFLVPIPCSLFFTHFLPFPSNPFLTQSFPTHLVPYQPFLTYSWPILTRQNLCPPILSRRIFPDPFFPDKSFLTYPSRYIISRPSLFDTSLFIYSQPILTTAFFLDQSLTDSFIPDQFFPELSLPDTFFLNMCILPPSLTFHDQPSFNQTCLFLSPCPVWSHPVPAHPVFSQPLTHILSPSGRGQI